MWTRQARLLLRQRPPSSRSLSSRPLSTQHALGSVSARRLSSLRLAGLTLVVRPPPIRPDRADRRPYRLRLLPIAQTTRASHSARGCVIRSRSVRVVEENHGLRAGAAQVRAFVLGRHRWRCMGVSPLPHSQLIEQRHGLPRLTRESFTQRSSYQPGGSYILVDNGGKDVSKLFKGIHPKGSLETSLPLLTHVGVLDHEGASRGVYLMADEKLWSCSSSARA